MIQNVQAVTRNYYGFEGQKLRLKSGRWHYLAHGGISLLALPQNGIITKSEKEKYKKFVTEERKLDGVKRGFFLYSFWLSRENRGC
jgi:hypothetical protein